MTVATKPRPKPTSHHRRRTGTHQKRSNHFMKTYWPYLPLLLVVGVGFMVNSLLSRPQVLGYATDTTVYGLLNDTNNQRLQYGDTALTLSDKLAQAAQAKANDMASRNYWSHNTPDNKEPWVFIDNTGYAYDAAGENLAYGFSSSKQTVTAWMNSPEHRTNILNNAYSEVGFGIANSVNYQSSGQETIVVALYAHPAPISIPAPQAAKSTVAPVAETKVTRVQLATNGASWMLYLVVGATCLMAGFIAQKHSRAWHRRVKKGEKFILSHPLLDITLVAFVMIGYILAQTAGFIQ